MPDRIWNAAEYTRLSRDDGDKAESNSIGSQRMLVRSMRKIIRISISWKNM